MLLGLFFCFLAKWRKLITNLGTGPRAAGQDSRGTDGRTDVYDEEQSVASTAHTKRNTIRAHLSALLLLRIPPLPPSLPRSCRLLLLAAHNRRRRRRRRARKSLSFCLFTISSFFLKCFALDFQVCCSNFCRFVFVSPKSSCFTPALLLSWVYFHESALSLPSFVLFLRF